MDDFAACVRADIFIVAAGGLSQHLHRAVREIDDPILANSDGRINACLLHAIVVETGIGDFDQKQLLATIRNLVGA